MDSISILKAAGYMYMWAEAYSITNDLEVNRTEEVNILCPSASVLR